MHPLFREELLRQHECEIARSIRYAPFTRHRVIDSPELSVCLRRRARLAIGCFFRPCPEV